MELGVRLRFWRNTCGADRGRLACYLSHWLSFVKGCVVSCCLCIGGVLLKPWGSLVLSLGLKYVNTVDDVNEA